jgi:predicted nucleic-acid-binding protein
LIGLDTNVLVRYLTLDDPRQAKIATEVIEGATTAGEPLFVSTVVMCEVVWVLERGYRFDRAHVEHAIDALLRTAQLHFREKDLLLAALADYRGGSGDFADYVIGRDAAAEGCSRTVTFDRALAPSPLFEVV